MRFAALLSPASTSPWRSSAGDPMPTAGDAGDGEHGEQHAGRMIVGGIARRGGDFQNTFTSGQRLADVRTVAKMGGVAGQVELRRHEELLSERKRARRAAPACAQACL